MPVSSSPPVGQIVKGKTQDESIDTSTTLQDDNHLTFPVKAGEVWGISAYLICEYNTSGQIKVGINGPTSGFFQIAASENCNGATPAYGTQTSLNTGISLVVVGAIAGAAAATEGFATGTATGAGGGGGGIGLTG